MGPFGVGGSVLSPIEGGGEVDLLRKVHLLLGCFFAPALFFFVASGVLQTFQFHVDLKDGGRAPEVLKAMADVHERQEFPGGPPGRSSIPFRGFVLAMSAGFLATGGLGITMAFRSYRPRWVVGALLAAGTTVPVFLLLL